MVETTVREFLDVANVRDSRHSLGPTGPGFLRISQPALETPERCCDRQGEMSDAALPVEPELAKPAHARHHI